MTPPWASPTYCAGRTCCPPRPGRWSCTAPDGDRARAAGARVRPPALRDGEGNKKLSKRDPESNLLIHRFRGMAPEGLLNYLALLGWSLSKDEDVFTPDQLVAAFDIRDVNPNPARFDPKKCEAINAEHLRRLEIDDFRDRLVPYLADVYPDPADPDWTARPLVSATAFAELTQREQEILTAAAPLIQTRIQLLRESRDMLGFLLVDDADLELEERAVSRLKDSAPQVLDTAIAALEALPGPWCTQVLEETLRAAIVDGMGIKPRLAFGPLRVAVTGRQVSPPLFESMEILGADSSWRVCARCAPAWAETGRSRHLHEFSALTRVLEVCGRCAHANLQNSCTRRERVYL
nr:glutamate--tRNA ligase family protein [Actinomyces ruminis]